MWDLFEFNKLLWNSQKKSSKYFQLFYFGDRDDPIQQEEGTLINQAILVWEKGAKNYLKDDNLMIMNLEIQFTDLSYVPHELKLSKSIKKSLKTIHLYVREDEYEEGEGKTKKRANRLIRLAKTLHKEYKVSITFLINY